MTSKNIINKGDPKYRKDTQNVMDVLKGIAKELKDSNESVDYEESETDGKPGDEESETDETTEVMESEGIHPAIREKLMDYLKDNKMQPTQKLKSTSEKKLQAGNCQKKTSKKQKNQSKIMYIVQEYIHS
jgi:hypothetical protein